MFTLHGYHGLQSGPEGLKHLNNLLLGLVGRLLLDGDFELIHAAVEGRKGLAIQLAPDLIVKGCTVGTQGGGRSRQATSWQRDACTTSVWIWTCALGRCPAAIGSSLWGGWSPSMA